MKTFSLILTSFILLNACSVNNKKNNNRFDVYENYIQTNKLSSKSEIYSFIFRGWNALDNYHLILTSSHHKVYLVTLENYCNDIMIKPQIHINQAIGNRLSTHFDSIIVPSEFNLKCNIKSIHILNKSQKNELLALSSNNK